MPTGIICLQMDIIWVRVVEDNFWGEATWAFEEKFDFKR